MLVVRWHHDRFHDKKDTQSVIPIIGVPNFQGARLVKKSAKNRLFLAFLNIRTAGILGRKKEKQ